MTFIFIVNYIITYRRYMVKDRIKKLSVYAHCKKKKKKKTNNYK